MPQLIDKIVESFNPFPSDSLGIGVLDFESKKIEAHSWQKEQGQIRKAEGLLFDLASLTKVFTGSLVYLTRPKEFSETQLNMLNHCSGLPAWIRLSKTSWQQQILSYTPSKAKTEYSDIGPLRLQLEIEKSTGEEYQSICSPYWKNLYFWKDIKDKNKCVVTGIRGGRKIQGEVHDDNAFVLNKFCAHTGLFSRPHSVLETLLHWDQSFDLRKTLKAQLKNANGRYLVGFDRVEDKENTLAGNLASLNTLGHLGFTGTSFWIDLEKNKAITILTNYVQYAWYDRKILNDFRKIISNLLWKY